MGTGSTSICPTHSLIRPDRMSGRHSLTQFKPWQTELNHLKPFHSARLRFSFSFGRVAVNLK